MRIDGFILLATLGIVLTTNCSNNKKTLAQPVENTIAETNDNAAATLTTTPDNQTTKPLQKLSQEELNKLMDVIDKKTDAAKGSSLMENFSGAAVCDGYIEVTLAVNTDQWRNEFRQRIVDSPAIVFSGPEKPVVDNRMGRADEYGLSLRPKMNFYATNVKTVEFVLYNNSNQTATFGESHVITFSDEHDTWYQQPEVGGVFDIAHHVQPGDKCELVAALHPALMDYKPGTYRFLKHISVGNHRDILLMAEFKLSDNDYEVKTAKRVPEPKHDKTYILEEKVYDVAEEMPQYPGGLKKLEKRLAMACPKGEKQANCIVEFIIEKDGTTSFAVVRRTSGSECLDNMALKNIESMPQWTPGKMNGQTVRVKYVAPVTFK